MPIPPPNHWSPEEVLSEVDLLTTPGMLAFYQRVELIEIFLIDPQKNPFLLLGFVIYEEALPCIDEEYLFEALQSLPRDYRLGIKRSHHTLEKTREILEQQLTQQIWQPGNEAMPTGELQALAKQFLPSEEGILNRALKNNWNGSYLIEFFDAQKERLASILEDKNLLNQASQVIQKVLPIPLATLSDRLGNILVQFPLRVFTVTQNFDDLKSMTFHLHWDPRVKEPPILRAVCRIEQDNTLMGARMGEGSTSITLDLGNHEFGMIRLELFDQEGHLLYARDRNYIRQITGGVFLASDSFLRQVRLPSGEEILLHISGNSKMQVDNPPPKYANWISKQIYQQEKTNLIDNLKFHQFPIGLPSQEEEHKQAIQWLRELLNKHASDSELSEIILADPFLAAEDILKTLYHCKVSSLPMRAMTAMSPKHIKILETYAEKKEDHQEETKEPVAIWMKKQAAILANSGNNLGINLEFRNPYKNHGRGFHDRFLIFIHQQKPPLCFSLGTSLNSFGKSHHVVMEVNHPQIVLDELEKLWQAMSHPDCLVWRHP